MNPLVKSWMINKAHILLYITLVFIFLPLRMFGIDLKNNLVLVFLAISVILSIALKRFILDKDLLILSVFFTTLFSFSFILNINNQILLKDVLELFKPFFFSFSFLLGVSLYKYYGLKFIEVFIYIMVFNFFFSFTVFFSELNFLSDLFKGRMSDDSATFQFKRFSGFFGYPSMYGIYSLLSIYLLKLIDVRHKSILYVLLSLGLLFSGSKAAIVVATFFILATNLYLFFVLLIPIIIFLLLNIGINNDVLHETYIAYKNIDFTTGNFGSAGHRVNELYLLYDSLGKNFFFGNGPSNYWLLNNHGPVESLLFFYGYKFGFFGLLYYLSILFFSVYMLLTNNKFRGFWLWVVIFLLAGIFSESIIDEYKVIILTPLLMGFFYGASLKSKG